MPTHMVNICAKFLCKRPIKYRDIAVHRIDNRQQTDDGRTDRRPYYIMLLPLTDGDRSIKSC